MAHIIGTISSAWIVYCAGNARIESDAKAPLSLFSFAVGIHTHTQGSGGQFNRTKFLHENLSKNLLEISN